MTSNGRKLKRGYKVWSVAVHVAKAELYGWLKLDRPTGDEPAPPGFVHFPEYGREWFEQLTAEHLITSKTRKGYAVTTWEIIPGRENHALDARVYARAAAAVAGLDRFQAGDWDRLEAVLGVTATAPAARQDAAPAAARPPGDAPSGPGGAQTGRGGSWLRRQRGGSWLKRR